MPDTIQLAIWETPGSEPAVIPARNYVALIDAVWAEIVEPRIKDEMGRTPDPDDKVSDVLAYSKHCEIRNDGETLTLTTERIRE